MKDVLKPIIDAAKNDDMHRVIELAEKQLDKFCDNNCVWTDHHPDCIRAEPKREQGAEKQEPVADHFDCGTYTGNHIGKEVKHTHLDSDQPKVEQEPEKYAMDIECTKCGATQSGILTVTHPQPAALFAGSYGTIDESAAKRIATALGWEPKREWVGLNWDDLPEIYVGDTAFLHGAKWAEAKLKEKNNVN